MQIDTYQLIFTTFLVATFFESVGHTIRDVIIWFVFIWTTWW
jgi:hypothetical protein